MRCFIAACLTQEIKNYLAQIQHTLKNRAHRAKWVNPDNLHITLKFLGEIKENELDAVKNAMAQSISGLKAFAAHLEEFGFFPNLNRPRVFFISAGPSKLINPIAQAIKNKMRVLGYHAKIRFHPHITVCRFIEFSHAADVAREIEKITLDKKIFPIEEITLLKSTLKTGGSTYEKILANRLLPIH